MPEDTQWFQCPVCFQRYQLPPASIPAIRVHMRNVHNRPVDNRWVKRRLTSERQQ